jgi:predicted dehydrogenase
VPTTVTALIEFAGGGSAQAVFSFDSGRRRTLLEVSGERGTAVLPDPNRFDGATELHLVDGDEPRTVDADGHPATRGTGVLELGRAIRAGVPERASGELAFHVLDVMLAAEESATAGRSVAVTSTVEVPPALPVGWDPYAQTL